jgi:hypothetical protein
VSCHLLLLFLTGLALSPAMISSMGWPSVFYIFGSFGIFWYSIWSSKASSTPSEDPNISNAEKVNRHKDAKLSAEMTGQLAEMTGQPAEMTGQPAVQIG